MMCYQFHPSQKKKKRNVFVPFLLEERLQDHSLVFLFIIKCINSKSPNVINGSGWIAILFIVSSGG